MDFDELKKELKSVTYTTMRQEEDAYLEVVIQKSELRDLNVALEKFFGQPAWTSPKDKLSSEINNIIGEFGGIIAGQTVYYFSDEKIKVFAMLWPWQDGEHITLKTGKK